MLSAEQPRRKIHLKHVAFVILFLLVSAIVTGFFVTNMPNNNNTDNANDPALVQRLVEEYKQNQKLPSEVKFAKIISFEIYNRYDNAFDARIELESGTKFSILNVKLNAPYYLDASNTTSAEGEKLSEEFITPGDTYYRNVNDGVWFLKYINGKEAGIFFAVYGKDSGFEKESKLKLY